MYKTRQNPIYANSHTQQDHHVSPTHTTAIWHVFIGKPTYKYAAEQATCLQYSHFTTGSHYTAVLCLRNNGGAPVKIPHAHKIHKKIGDTDQPQAFVAQNMVSENGEKTFMRIVNLHGRNGSQSLVRFNGRQSQRFRRISQTIPQPNGNRKANNGGYDE